MTANACVAHLRSLRIRIRYITRIRVGALGASARVRIECLATCSSNMQGVRNRQVGNKTRFPNVQLAYNFYCYYYTIIIIIYYTNYGNHYRKESFSEREDFQYKCLC